jgi:predicted acylesterase/phospholipase RssA
MLMTGLPQGVELVLNAASLTTGRQFRFLRDRLGEWEYGYPSYGDAPVRLSYAVVASSAAPVLVPPVRVQASYAWTGNEDNTNARPTGDLWMADGGVYDNLGTEWFLGGDAPAPFLIISESSGCLRLEQKTYSLKDLLGRAQGIQYDQSRSVRQRWLQDQMTLHRQIERWRKQGKWDASMDRGVQALIKQGVILSIDRVIGEQRWVQPAHSQALPRSLVARVSSVRTDLDRFLPEEATLLAYHGYTLAHVYLRAYAPGMAVSEPRWTLPLSGDAVALYERALSASSRSIAFDRRRW